MLAPRVIVAMITPFDQSGEVDFGAHRHNLELLMDRKVTGFLMAGSTGEGFYLEPGERQALVEESRQTVGDEPLLICGVTAESVRGALAQLQEAAAGGADAGLVVTPTSLIRDRTRLVEQHFAQLAAASPIPIMLYSVPPVTAYTYPLLPTVTSLGLDNVVGMKDSGGDVIRLQQIVSGVGGPMNSSRLPLTSSRPLLYNGSSRAISLAGLAGIYGAITASVNYATALVQRLVDEPQETNWHNETDTEVQNFLTEVAETVESEGIAGIKSAAGLAGMSPGFPRSPIHPASDEIRDRIEKVLQKYGLAQ